MAYVSQEKKKELAVGIKSVLKKYKMKGSIAVDNYSTLVVNLKSGAIDFAAQNEHYQVNVYWVGSHWTGLAKEFLLELLEAMKGEGTGWFDKSDIQTDYFHTAWYNNINIGKWDKTYELTAKVNDITRETNLPFPYKSMTWSLDNALIV